MMNERRAVLKINMMIERGTVLKIKMMNERGSVLKDDERKRGSFIFTVWQIFLTLAS